MRLKGRNPCGKRCQVKTLISLLLCSACLLAFPLSACAAPPSRPPEGIYRWYVKRNDEHKTPVLPSEFSFLSECGGWYCDRSETPEKTLYLTFDAGYENGNVARILDVLKAEQVPAAFFILEHLVKSESPLVGRMIDEGHLVCNHTATHKNLARCSQGEFRAELERMEKSYRGAMGCEISRYFRPPEGVFTIDNLKTAQEMGYRTVFWSFAYADWDNCHQPDPEAAISKILKHTHPGAVLLLHPTSETNANILPSLIKTWREQGYRFGTLDELTAK